MPPARGPVNRMSSCHPIRKTRWLLRAGPQPLRRSMLYSTSSAVRGRIPRSIICTHRPWNLIGQHPESDLGRQWPGRRPAPSPSSRIRVSASLHHNSPRFSRLCEGDPLRPASDRGGPIIARTRLHSDPDRSRALGVVQRLGLFRFRRARVTRHSLRPASRRRRRASRAFWDARSTSKAACPKASYEAAAQSLSRVRHQRVVAGDEEEWMSLSVTRALAEAGRAAQGVETLPRGRATLSRASRELIVTGGDLSRVVPASPKTTRRGTRRDRAAEYAAHPTQRRASERIRPARDSHPRARRSARDERKSQQRTLRTPERASERIRPARDSHPPARRSTRDERKSQQRTLRTPEPASERIRPARDSHPRARRSAWDERSLSNELSAHQSELQSAFAQRETLSRELDEARGTNEGLSNELLCTPERASERIRAARDSHARAH